MNYEETMPIADKILHVDGSVTTMAGEIILTADPNRAKEYENRAAIADKWLRSDGSVIDMAGNIILQSDENRALDYASRSATAILSSSSGGIDGENIWLGSRAEYNALPSEERNDPAVIHFIREGS